MTLFVSYFSKSKWCGWRSLPPGFLFPVKEQVACMKDLIKGPITGPFFMDK